MTRLFVQYLASYKSENLPQRLNIDKVGSKFCPAGASLNPYSQKRQSHEDFRQIWSHCSPSITRYLPQAPPVQMILVEVMTMRPG